MPLRLVPRGSPGRDPPSARDEFVHALHRALAHLDDPAYLRRRPLTRFVDPTNRDGDKGEGGGVREQLLAAIQSLRPGADAPATSAAWRHYHLLAGRYAEGRTIATVQRELGIGKSEYYREHQRALEALAAALRDRAGPGGDWRPPQPLTLPAPPHPLIGRDRVLATAVRLLQDGEARLLTLTGPPGVGKTRLALEVAATLGSAFPDGAGFVDLARLRDSSLVVAAIASALGRRETGEQSWLALVQQAIRDRRLLLVLDNFEQVAEAAPDVAELLQACRRLAFLVTSREALRLRWEHVLLIPPLELPTLDPLPELPILARVPAVALYVARAKAIDSEFALSAANARAVAELSVHLDGLPLALELAAARVATLTPHAINQHLGQRLDLLASRGRDRPSRQRTMREAVAWSYDLLDAPEQAFLRSLAVFVGGFTAGAAEQVHRGRPEAVGGSRAPALETLDLLSSLVDKGLVRREDQPSGEARFGMLETIREYAREQLAATGQADALARRHAAYYLAYAEACAAADFTPGQGGAFARLDREQDNLRQAMDWAVRHDVDAGYRLATALENYWWRHGRDRDLAARWVAALLPHRHTFPRTRVLGRFLHAAAAYAQDTATYRQLLADCVAVSRDVGDRGFAAQVLQELAVDRDWHEDHAGARALYAESLADADPGLRPWVLATAGDLDRRTGDVGRARAQLEAAAAEARRVGIPQRLGLVLDHLGKLERVQGDLARAAALSEESRAAFREAGDALLVAWLDRALGRLARLRGDLVRARALQERALATARDLNMWRLEAEALDELGLIAAADGDLVTARRRLAEALASARDYPRRVAAELRASLGLVARAEGDHAEARGLFAEALAFWQEARHPHGVAVVRGHLGVTALQEGNLPLARDLLVESLTARHALGDRGGTATLLESFAGLAALSDEPERAYRLLGAADRLRAAIGNPAPRIWTRQRDPWIEPARRALDDTSLHRALATGQAMGVERAVADALRT